MTLDRNKHEEEIRLQIEDLPFDADAKRRSSELKLNVRIFVRCPGISTTWSRVDSSGASLLFERRGML